MNDDTLMHPEDWECPNCRESWDEDEMISTCQEPFNGNMFTCEGCNHEFSVQVRFLATDCGVDEDSDEDEGTDE